MNKKQNPAAHTSSSSSLELSGWNRQPPHVLVFDVNETLLDFESLSPLFERVFGHKKVLREWLRHPILYSMTVTLLGLFRDYFSLGQGLLRMVGTIHGVKIQESDVEEVKRGMLTMPAHPDVAPGLKQ